MKQRHGSVICRGAFCDGMGCILHHPLSGSCPLLLRKSARGGGKAATSYYFVSSGHEAVDRGRLPAFRSPPSAPTYELVSFPTLAGRGGSVSRRDHDQAYRRPPPLTGGTNHAEKYPPNASRSSGEGVWGRGASLREAASPQNLPPPPSLRGGSAREGSFSTEKLPSLAIPLHFILLPLSSSCRSGRETLLAERRRL